MCTFCFSDDLLQEEGLDGSNLVSGINNINLAPEMDPTVLSIRSGRHKHGSIQARPAPNYVSASIRYAIKVVIAVNR